MILSKGLRDCPKRASSLPCENDYKREQNKQKFAGHKRNMARDYWVVLLLLNGLFDSLWMGEFLRLSCVSLEPKFGQEDPSSGQFLL
jgi:hypothetical protein